jgi:hypothetical protein
VAATPTTAPATVTTAQPLTVMERAQAQNKVAPRARVGVLLDIRRPSRGDAILRMSCNAAMSQV